MQLSQNVNVVVGILRHLNLDLHASPCFFIRMPQNQMKLAALLILRPKSPTASPPPTPPALPPLGSCAFTNLTLLVPVPHDVKFASAHELKSFT